MRKDISPMGTKVVPFLRLGLGGSASIFLKSSEASPSPPPPKPFKEGLLDCSSVGELLSAMSPKEFSLMPFPTTDTLASERYLRSGDPKLDRTFSKTQKASQASKEADTKEQDVLV